MVEWRLVTDCYPRATQRSTPPPAIHAAFGKIERRMAVGAGRSSFANSSRRTAAGACQPNWRSR